MLGKKFYQRSYRLRSYITIACQCADKNETYKSMKRKERQRTKKYNHMCTAQMCPNKAI